MVRPLFGEKNLKEGLLEDMRSLSRRKLPPLVGDGSKHPGMPYSFLYLPLLNDNLVVQATVCRSDRSYGLGVPGRGGLHVTHVFRRCSPCVFASFTICSLLLQRKGSAGEERRQKRLPATEGKQNRL